MKKILDKLKDKIKINRKISIFLIGLTIIAIITGSLFVTILNETDQKLINDYVINFFKNVENDNLNYLDAFKNSFISNLLYVIGIWLLGISVIGIPIILFMYFTKAFILGFAIANIIVNFKLKGCLLSLIYIFPHHIINLFIFMILVIYAYSISLKIIDAIFKKKTIDFKQLMNKYLIILSISIVVILLTTIIEVFVTPALIKIILPIIY